MVSCPLPRPRIELNLKSVLTHIRVLHRGAGQSKAAKPRLPHRGW
jgi:hypothetical protein